MLCQCIRITIQGRSWQKFLIPSILFNSEEVPKVSRVEDTGLLYAASVSALGQPAQFHRVGLSRAHRLVRLRQPGQVLCIERAKRSLYSRSYPHDTLLQIWPKKGNPKIAAKRQLWAAHRGRAPRTRRAILLHLLHCPCCIIHSTTSALRMRGFVHLQTRNALIHETRCEFFSGRLSSKVGFSPIRESTARPIVPAVDPKLLSAAVALSTPTKLSDEEKLEVLRRLDQFRQWHSLDEKRYCLVCGNVITGRQIEVAGGTRGNGPLRLSCPTERCNSIPMDWVLPTNEILVKVEKVAAEERKTAAFTPAAVTISNRKTVPSHKPRDDFGSRLLKFVLLFKRYS
jgi:hypothetical protein